MAEGGPVSKARDNRTGEGRERAKAKGVAFEMPATGIPALAVLLEQARKKTMRVWAEQSPFDLKDSLKRRGYSWSDGSDGRPRSWYVDLDESNLDDEIEFLKSEIYLRDEDPRLQTLTAFDRFSVRG